MICKTSQFCICGSKKKSPTTTYMSFYGVDDNSSPYFFFYLRRLLSLTNNLHLCGHWSAIYSIKLVKHITLCLLSASMHKF